MKNLLTTHLHIHEKKIFKTHLYFSFLKADKKPDRKIIPLIMSNLRDHNYFPSFNQSFNKQCVIKAKCKND